MNSRRPDPAAQTSGADPARTPRTPPRAARAPSVGEITADIPRLPETAIRDYAEPVALDERMLARPQTISGMREVEIAEAPPPKAKPLPAHRNKMLAVNTAVSQQIIGGRYRVIARIGQGGMGKVYKVQHTHLARTFALKIISDGAATSDSKEARELFYREARFASAMQHPHVASVVDFGEDEHVGMFMVMELVEGEALNKILFVEKQLSLRYAAEVVLQLAEALHYIHQQGVVHCDIKTENILVTETDEPGKRRRLVAKLLDFGLARPLNPDRNKNTLSGTPHYVAPERIRGQPASPASDVYSLGILFYELITGRVPWDGPVQTILNGHLDEIPPAPSAYIAEGLDEAAETLILRALAKDPAARHRDMAAFIYELRTVLDMIGLAKKRPGKRVVLERSGMQREALARTAFDACRLPLALLDADGIILCANPAFAKFVMGAVIEVERLPISATPLATAWAASAADLRRTLRGDPVRRMIEIDVGAGELRRLLLWLDGVNAEQVMLGVQPLDL